ncbi:MAG: N-acetyltransferase [Cyanobacteria bacterium SID2]|nr:N-acetyltransferase [Cyanobacteria bacterium SID2]
MHVRHACESDLPSVVEIYNASIPSYRATADLYPVSIESRRSWFFNHRPDRYPLWVAESQGQVVAWLSFRPFYGRPAYAATSELGIYVAPDFQGRGIGSHLLEMALANGRNLGSNTLLAFVFAHNAPSLKLFDRFGFCEWGYLPRVAELAGVERDVVILGKRL